jgi:hypothetical protein
MKLETRRLQQLLVCVGCLMLPGLLARYVGLSEASGVVTMACLGVLVICARLGWRQALGGSVALALLSALALVSQHAMVPATALLALTAALLGLAGRWQQQPSFWLLMVSLVMLITDMPVPQALAGETAARLSALLLLSCSLTTLAQSRLGTWTPATDPAAITVQHSWRRSAAYGLMLATTTAITTPIALSHHWHTMGFWMILSPFLVLRPHTREGWNPALHRALGTIAGVLLVHGLALALLPEALLRILAIVLGTGCALTALKKGHPALFVLLLTMTTVLFNSTTTTLLLMANERLQSNAIGIGIALGVMVLAEPLERRLARRRPG